MYKNKLKIAKNSVHTTYKENRIDELNITTNRNLKCVTREVGTRQK